VPCARTRPDALRFQGVHFYYADSALGGQAGNTPALWPVPFNPFSIEYRTGAANLYFDSPNYKYFTAANALFLSAVILSAWWFYAFFAQGQVRMGFLLITLATLSAGATVAMLWLNDLAAGITFIAVPAWLLYLWGVNVSTWANLEVPAQSI